MVYLNKSARVYIIVATCYENEVHFPTDQKFLWESVYWSFHQMKIICKALKLNLTPTKCLKWKRCYIGFSKMRRMSTKRSKLLTSALLHLLKKTNKELERLEKQYNFELPSNYYK